MESLTKNKRRKYETTIQISETMDQGDYHKTDEIAAGRNYQPSLQKGDSSNERRTSGTVSKHRLYRSRTDCRRANRKGIV